MFLTFDYSSQEGRVEVFININEARRAVCPDSLANQEFIRAVD